MSAPPCVCTGEVSCGIAGALPTPETRPCGVCGRPACLVAKCGQVRCRHVHGASMAHAVRVAERLAGPACTGKSQPAPAELAAVASGEDKPLRLLSALETTHAPTRKVGNVLKPAVLCPPLPGITSVAHVVTGYAWQRSYKGGAVVRLDRNAAYLSAAASVLVAHGPLEHTGPMNAYDPNRAGYFLVQAHPWPLRTMPHPLGRPRAEQVWVPAPTLQLLHQLAEQGRWADVEILDSYTAHGVRLTRWTDMVRDLRAQVLQAHGPNSQRYDELKTAYSQALTMMIGEDNPGTGRRWKCKTHRPDWAHTVYAQASATLWRTADRCAGLVDKPDLAPVAIVNTDEIHLPEAALTLVTRGDRAPIRLDPTGQRLGSYKVKAA